MVPADEATLVISDPKSMKKTQKVAEQPSSGPPPPGSWFNPIYVEPGSVTIDSTRDPPGSVPQQLQLLWRHAGWVRHQDWPYSPTSPAWQMEGTHRVQGGDREGVSWDGLPENHHQTDRAHTMGQQSDVSKEGKQQAENLPWPQRPK